MLTLKRKLKCHFMKWNYVLKGGKEWITSSFSCSTSKLLSFFISRMSVKENFVQKLEKQSWEKL
jgi:hypothetical protein